MEVIIILGIVFVVLGIPGIVMKIRMDRDDEKVQ
jgi:hypothetical protein